jgi:lysyl endopeptidase
MMEWMDTGIPYRTAFAAALLAAAASAPAFGRPAAAHVALGPLSIAGAATPSEGAPPEGAPRQVGFARSVAELQTAQGVKRQLQWARLPEGGTIAAVSVTSPGASAVRAALRVGDLPAAATLRFSAPADAGAREVPAEAVLAALRRNRDAGETGAAARTYWSPIVTGDTIVIEVELPPGADPGEVAFTTPLVSHLTAGPGDGGGDSADAEAVFTTDGSSFACPGVLVRGARDGSRYLLTRERCVSTQAAASTMQAFWKAGGTPAQSGVGASLLYASIETDTALLLVDAPPPRAAALVRASPPGIDPALEQWLGNAASQGAIVPAAAFSFP